MEMYCCKCNAFLGEIIKGKYKKGMYFLCSLCKGAMDLGSNSNSNSKPMDLPSGFESLFGGFGKK